MAIPASEIPASLLANAQGIVIIPDLVKGGFVVGVRHGRGIAMVATSGVSGGRRLSLRSPAAASAGRSACK